MIMEIDELFGSRQKNDSDSSESGVQQSVSLVDDLVFAVWIYGFRKNFVQHNLHLEYTDLAGSASGQELAADKKAK